MSANDFFLAKSFAVAGASSNPSKFGYKVLAWYKQHDLPVTPINPKPDAILGLTPITSLDALQDPRTTSLSIITPPHITSGLLDDALRVGVPSVWLQPGSFDASVMEKVNRLGTSLNVIAQGRCILVEGSEGLAIAEQHGGRKLYAQAQCAGEARHDKHRRIS